jgi:hypothetical protein
MFASIQSLNASFLLKVNPMDQENSINEQNRQTQNRDLEGKIRIRHTDKIDVKHARFLELLKSEYGYTNENAIAELERLLRQFSKINRSLGIHHARSGKKPLSD